MSLFCNVPHFWGMCELTHILSPSPAEEILVQEDLSWPSDVPSCRSVFIGKVKLFLLLHSTCPNLYFFAPVVCWNSSPGSLDFHNSSFSHEWLRKAMFFIGSWTMAERDWSQFTGYHRVHSWEICTPITEHVSGQDSSWVPWCIMLISTASSKAPVSMGGCQIAVDEGGIQLGMFSLSMLLISLLWIIFIRDVEGKRAKRHMQ